MEKNVIIKSVCAAALVAVSVVTLSGIQSGSEVLFRVTKAPGEQLTREDIEYQNVEAPEASLPGHEATP